MMVNNDVPSLEEARNLLWKFVNSGYKKEGLEDVGFDGVLYFLFPRLYGS
jgi:hypothetical protein